jgi:hypothetical protein
MSDTTATTKDVKELISKTWFEGPIAKKVSEIPIQSKDVSWRERLPKLEEKRLTSGYCRLSQTGLNFTLCGMITAPWNQQPLLAIMSR